MRQILIGGICGWLMMLLMIHTGYSALTWEFWAAFGLMFAYGMNMAID